MAKFRLPVSPRISVVTPMSDSWLVSKDRIQRVQRSRGIIEVFAPREYTFLASRVPCHFGPEPVVH